MLLDRTLSRRPWLAIVLGMAIAGCSDGASKEEKYAAAVEAIEADIRLEADRWADEAATEWKERLDSGASVESGELITRVQKDSLGLADKACEAVGDNPGIAFDNYLSDAQPLGDFVRQRVAMAIGRHPRLLYELEVGWPDAWLLDPSGSPLATVTEYTPSFLMGFLIEDLIEKDGSVALPEEDEPEYRIFDAWMDQSGNLLAARSSSFGKKVTEAIEDCVADLE